LDDGSYADAHWQRTNRRAAARKQLGTDAGRWLRECGFRRTVQSQRLWGLDASRR
jgi:hypothetical protein